MELDESNASIGDDDQEQLLPAEESTASPKKRKVILGPVNWRNLVATTCLWLAYGVCTAAFSLLGPFFPEEVIISC